MKKAFSRSPVATLTSVLVLPSVAAAQEPTQATPVVRQSVYHDTSPPLRELALMPSEDNQVMAEPQERSATQALPLVAAVDPVLQTSAALPNGLTLVRSFEGINTAGSFPIDNFAADLSGAVGPNHYVQTVNFAYAVYDKNGNVLLGPLRTGSFWIGFGPCATGIWSDAVVLYDHEADRWFVSRFARDLATANDWYQ